MQHVEASQIRDQTHWQAGSYLTIRDVVDILFVHHLFKSFTPVSSGLAIILLICRNSLYILDTL